MLCLNSKFIDKAFLAALQDLSLIIQFDVRLYAGFRLDGEFRIVRDRELEHDENRKHLRQLEIVTCSAEMCSEDGDMVPFAIARNSIRALSLRKGYAYELI